MALVLLATALYIPYMAILCAGLRLSGKPGPAGQATPPGPISVPGLASGVIGLAAFLVWSMNHDLDAAGFGPLATGQMLTGPEFSAAGRLDLYPLPNPFFDLVYWPVESIGLFLELGLVAGLVSLALALPVLVAGWRRAPWADLAARSRPLAALLAGSLLLYLAARVFALALFVPDRYVSYSINLLYALVLAVGLRYGLGRRWASGRVGGWLLVLLGGVCGAWRLYGVGLYDYRSEAPLYAAVAALPKDALLAGNPELLDNVLTFGRRNVLASFELAHPWSLGYWRRYAPRLRPRSRPITPRIRPGPGPGPGVRGDASGGGGSGLRSEGNWRADRCSRLSTPGIRELAARPGDFILRDRTRFAGQEIAPGLFLIDLRPLAALPRS